MKNQIIDELLILENNMNIKILYAVESGSRAWGFSSTNSDWDVRFIYTHNLDWHLSLDNRKNSFEKIIENDIDLSGWELKKTLGLFRKSNPSLMEWLNSTDIYIEKYSAIKVMRDIFNEYFNPKVIMYHYLHQCLGIYKDYLTKERVILKKYFYALRSIISCLWIKEYSTIPPIKFIELLNSGIVHSDIIKIIMPLLEQKQLGLELGKEIQSKELNIFIKNNMDLLYNYLDTYNFKLTPDTSKLELILKDTIKEVYGSDF